MGLTDLEALAGGRSLVFRGTRTAQSARGSSATGAAIRLPPAGTAVVVKTMRDATVENARVLREEFDLLQRIDDPHIVTAYDLIASTSARSYLVLRDVPGCTLATEIARRVATGRSFAPEEVCGIMCQILRGLRSLHAHATHGDIKPSNLMIDLTGRVTLIDLGNAVAAEDISTRTAVAGTRGYLAPEAFGAYECSEPWRADIFALGVIAYELFVGQLPRTDSVIHHTFDLDDHLRSIPRFWRIFIHWCGKQSPWKRPDTAEVLLDYLEHRAHAPEDIDGEVPHSTIIGRALAGSLRPFAVFTVVVFAILGFIHPAFWPLPAIAITIFARERTREISREGRSATQILTDSVSNIVLFCSALTKGALLAIATLFPLVALGAGLLVLAENDHLWTNAHPAEIIGVSIILSAPTVFAYRWLSRKGESLN